MPNTQRNIVDKSDITVNLAFITILSILPLMIVMISGLILTIGLSNLQNETMDLIITYISMVIGLVIFPYGVIRKVYKTSFEDLGLKRVSFFEGLTIIFILIGIPVYLAFRGHAWDVVLMLGVQTLCVASAEEFWARGVLCFLLGKITKYTWVILIVSSLIFAFITHMNRPILDNLFNRLPGSIIMGIIYLKTKKLSYSILFHYGYNMISFF